MSSSSSQLETLKAFRSELSLAAADVTRAHEELLSRVSHGLAAKKFETSSEIDSLRFDCTLELARLCFLTSASRLGLDAVSIAARHAELIEDLPRVRQMHTLLGALHGETGNLGAALESYMAALSACERTRQPKDWALVWLNVSNSLITNSQLEQFAMRVLDLSLSHASQIEEADLRTQIESTALTNLAVAALRESQYGLGLRAGRRALKLSAQLPINLWTAQTQAVLLFAYGNLALRVRDLARAEQCVSSARAIQSQWMAPRSMLLTENLIGLFDAYTGKAERGIARIAKCLEASRASMPNIQGTFLRALIEANEATGRFDEAHRLQVSLAAFCGESGSDDALFHHRRHMEALTQRRIDHSRGQLQTAASLRLASGRGASSARRHPGKQTEVLENLAVAAELNDDPSGEHPFRVARLAELLARELGVGDDFCATISVAARLHDIGKTGVPPELLRKPSPLTASERVIVQRHTTVGADLLSLTAIDELTMAAEIALYHHECWDGSGYPSGLAGTEIPIAARITSIADTFDALTHDRNYRPRMSINRALELISERSGRSFEPVLVRSLADIVRRLLELHSDLDDYLAADARETSSLLRAKREMSRHVLRLEDVN